MAGSTDLKSIMGFIIIFVMMRLIQHHTIRGLQQHCTDLQKLLATWNLKEVYKSAQKAIGMAIEREHK